MIDSTAEHRAERIAVVGAGISGLSAAYILHKSGFRVTLLEKEHSCGGHSLTDDSLGFSVDLGFQVFNLTTYPHLTGLLETLGVDSTESEMSFSLSMDEGKLEWASHSLSTIFAQRENIWRLSFWRMIYDVIRFGREAPKVLENKNSDKYCDMSLGEYLKKHSYSQAFQYNYLLPMCAAVWSIPNSQVLEFPVGMLVRFWHNHHLLDLFQRPVWRVVKDRSCAYVRAILQELEDIWINAEVTAVTPSTPLSPVVVELSNKQKLEFDAVVLATHSDVSLKLLGKAAQQELREVLEAIPYGNNEVWVHTDKALMPKRREAWASWNCISRSAAGDDASVCVSYWLNRLQNLPQTAPDVFVTLNPVAQPQTASVLRRLTLAHPIFGKASRRAQQRLPHLQGSGGVYLAGAWCGFGFHEDGLKSGIAAAELLGAQVPWTPKPTSPKIGLLDRLCIAVFHRFARQAISEGFLRIILPSGQELKYGDPSTGKVKPGWRGLPSQRATVKIYSCAFFRKIITRHDTGLGESYMDGDFEVVGDLGSLLAVLTANARSIEAKRGALGLVNWVGDKMLLLAHLARGNSLTGSQRNVEQHYDAGNEMYRLFLDPTMTYSSGIHQAGDTLEDAQNRKLDSLISLAKLTAQDHVLEIGCGWGSLAIRAAQKVGCRWTGVTLSRAQLEEARQRVKAAGLDDRISLLLCDYRDLAASGSFQKIISCEMIEAVGQEHLDSYFRALSSALAPGGLAVIQAISEPNERYEDYCASSDFIREHIFPGGHLPSLDAMMTAARPVGLAVAAVSDIGPDYALTLRAWRSAWEQRQPEALQLGYSQRFWRKYRFYFAYCEAAFDAKYIHNFQITWVKEAAVAERRAGESPQPGDPFTQILLAVYFFLAGIAVGHSRRLWVMPLTSALYAALLAATDAAAAGLARVSPRLRKAGEEGQAWLSVDVVHLIHSAATFTAASVLACGRPQAWNIRHRASLDDQLLPDLLVCTSAGFFGFQLFTLVHKRLFKRVYKLVLHFTILLVLFGSAAYKSEHTALLSCSLVSELATVFYLIAKLQDLHDVPSTHWLRRLLLLACEIPSTVFFRLMPHAFIAATVLLNADSFSNKGMYLAAVIGAIYTNVANVRRLVSLARAVAAPKLHSD